MVARIFPWLLAAIVHVSAQAGAAGRGPPRPEMSEDEDISPEGLPLSWLTEEELQEMGRRKLMSLREAEHYFNAEAAKAIEFAEAHGANTVEDDEEDWEITDINTNLRAGRKSNSEDAKAFTSSSSAEASKSKKAKDELENMDYNETLENEYFMDNWEEAELSEPKFKEYASLLRPMLKAQMCTQIDIDLWALVPGLQLNLGLNGALFHHRSGCWGMQFDAMVGFSWGIKFLGFSFGLKINAAGTVSLDETTPAAALGLQPGDDIEDIEFIDSRSRKSGFDPWRCQTRNPWTVVQTFIEHEWRRIFSKKQVQEALEKKKLESDDADGATFVEKKAAEVRKLYTDLLANKPFGFLLHSKEALHSALGKFLPRLPAYADQVMRQLVDKSEWTKKTRFVKARGRFWAKWPSKGDMEDMKEDDEDFVLEEPVTGIDTRASGEDQRVMNFAKPMRYSEIRDDPLKGLDFWQELAMSGGNLFVRVVGDIEAMFNLYFADDPYWDGRCSSLAAEFQSVTPSKEFLRTYPWASRETKKSGKPSQFFARPKDGSGKPYTRVNPDVEGANYKETRVAPHLWCALMTHGPAESAPDEGEDIRKVREIERPMLLEVYQSCTSADFDFQPIDTYDRLEWTNSSNCYSVMRADSYQGKLVDKTGKCICKDCISCPADDDSEADEERTAEEACMTKEALKMDLWIGEQELNQRLECQDAELGVPFMRLFPHFIVKVKFYLAKIEAHLLNINLCRGKTHDLHRISHRVKELPEAELLVEKEIEQKCATAEAALAFIKEESKAVVHHVREFLLEVGAEDPQKAVSSYIEGELPLSPDETALIEQAARNDTLSAPITRQLGMDFLWSLHHKTGVMWKHLRDMKDEIMEASDFTKNVMPTKIDRKRPPLDLSVALTIEWGTTPNGFCTPDTSLLVTRYTKQVFYNSYSNSRTSESCYVARIRPGDFFILVQRCSHKDYTDWRVKFQGVVIKGDVLGSPSGILGTLTNGLDLSKVIGAGVVGAGVAASPLIDKMAMKMHNHPMLKAIGIMAASTSPMLGAVAVSAAVASEASFTAICHAFMDFLSNHGVVWVASTAASFSPVSIKLALVGWGAVVYRERQVQLYGGPGAKDLTSPRTVTRVSKVVSFHTQMWNRMDLIFSVPGLLTIAPTIDLAVDLDLTPWAANYVNRLYFRKHKARVRQCYRCLFRRKGFCDYRGVLGNMWKKEHDDCEEDTAEAEALCEGTTTVQGSKTSAAVWYSPEAGPQTCMSMSYPKANSEEDESPEMKHFLTGRNPLRSYEGDLDQWNVDPDADFDDILAEGPGGSDGGEGGDAGSGGAGHHGHHRNGVLVVLTWMVAIACFIGVPAGLAMFHYGLHQQMMLQLQQQRRRLGLGGASAGANAQQSAGTELASRVSQSGAARASQVEAGAGEGGATSFAATRSEQRESMVPSGAYVGAA